VSCGSLEQLTMSAVRATAVATGRETGSRFKLIILS
jgi:hypothetical protein